MKCTPVFAEHLADVYQRSHYLGPGSVVCAMHHLVALLLLSPALAIQRLSHEEQFLRFKQKFAKVYSSEAEERLRFAVFKELPCPSSRPDKPGRRR